MPGPRSAARTLVKICGLTRLEDARAAAEAGADWIGFIVHARSPRAIDPETAAGIGAEVEGVTRVAVMVGVTADQALEIATRARADRVQIHRPAERWPATFPLPVTIALSVAPSGQRSGDLPDARHLLMLDTAHASLAGGTGETFPWSVASAIARERDILLAGGLDAGNVGHAIEQVAPFGVDASSRLETSAGIKDAERIRRFVRAVREVDARVREAGR